MHGHKNIHLPIHYFLALLWAHPILHISRIRVNQFALVVLRRASHREFTVLRTYEYSSEKQVQRKNTAVVG